MLALTLCALALAPVLDDAPAVTVEALKFDPGGIQEAAKVEVKVKEGDTTVTYRGVPLRSLLADRLGKPPGMADLRKLSDAVLIVRASDDYRAAVSAVEVAMDETGQKYLLAVERDGKPLGEKQGPVRLIVPGDPKPVRSVRMIVGVDLVRFNAGTKPRSATPSDRPKG